MYQWEEQTTDTGGRIGVYHTGSTWYWCTSCHSPLFWLPGTCTIVLYYYFEISSFTQFKGYLNSVFTKCLRARCPLILLDRKNRCTRNQLLARLLLSLLNTNKSKYIKPFIIIINQQSVWQEIQYLNNGKSDFNTWTC